MRCCSQQVSHAPLEFDPNHAQLPRQLSVFHNKHDGFGKVHPPTFDKQVKFVTVVALPLPYPLLTLPIPNSPLPPSPAGGVGSPTTGF